MPPTDLLALRAATLKEGERELDILRQRAEDLQDQYERAKEAHADRAQQFETDLEALERTIRLAGIETPDFSEEEVQIPEDYPAEGSLPDKIVWALEKRGVPSEPNEVDDTIRPFEPDLRHHAVTETCSRIYRAGRLTRDDSGPIGKYGLPDWNRNIGSADVSASAEPISSNGVHAPKPSTEEALFN